MPPTSKMPLPPRAARFARECGRRAKITFVGPLLDEAPQRVQGAVMLVDGGARWQASLPDAFDGPTLSVGDGDSCPGGALDAPLPSCKDYSDLGFALAVLSGTDVARLDLLGFLGGRRDHEWINIGELVRFAQSQAQVQIDLYAAANDPAPAITVLSAGAHSLKHTGTFTLAHLTDAATALRGAVDYPLGAGSSVPAHSSVGLSNRADGRFQLHSDQVSVLFWVHDDPAAVYS